MDNWRHAVPQLIPYSASYPRVSTLYTATTTNFSASPETQNLEPVRITEFLPYKKRKNKNRKSLFIHKEGSAEPKMPGHFWHSRNLGFAFGEAENLVVRAVKTRVKVE